METFLQNNMWVLILAMLWVLPWKGYALWTAAKNGSNRWFLVLLIINTFAILDIIFIFYIAKKKPSDVARLLKSKI